MGPLMRVDVRRGGRLARATVEVVRTEEVTFLAAAIAYYAFVSAIPGLLIAFAVATTVGGDALATRVVAAGQEFLTPAGQDLLADAITGSRGRAGATVVGLGVLLWSTLRVFRGLDIAFARIYHTSRSPTLFAQIRDAAVVLVTVGVAIGAVVAVGTWLGATRLPIGANVAAFAVLLLGLVVAFLPLYVVFPNVRVTIGGVVPGAVVAAVSWVLLEALFQFYVAAAPRYELYGAIGAVLLLVTWFYLGAIALLVGAATNAAISRENRQGQGFSSRDGRTNG